MGFGATGEKRTTSQPITTNNQDRKENMGDYKSQAEIAATHKRRMSIANREAIDRRIAKAKQLAQEYEHKKQMALADEWLAFMADARNGGTSVPPPKKPKPDFLKSDWWGRANIG